jgi:hypothetical protein
MRRLALLLPVLLVSSVAGAEEPEPFDPGYGDSFLQTSSPLVNEKGLLEAVFQHRFNQPVNQAGGTDLYGLDSGANVGLGLKYVPVENLAVSAYRSSASGDYEFALKATFLRPTAKLPIAIGARAGLDWLTKAQGLDQKVGGFGQLLVATTIGNRVTLAAAPTFVSNTPLFENVWNVPLVLQVRLSKTLYASGEWVFRNRDLEGSVGQWSFAVEKTVWRHRFAVWVGNSGATTVDQLMAADFRGGVTESNLRIGFNIVRQFDIAVE